MEATISKACMGKSESRGGLNLPDIKILAQQHGIQTNGRKRDEILDHLCAKLGLSIKTQSSQSSQSSPFSRSPFQLLEAPSSIITPLSPFQLIKAPRTNLRWSSSSPSSSSSSFQFIEAPIRTPRTPIAELKNLCRNAQFLLHDDFFHYFTSDNNNVYYKGDKVNLDMGHILGRGTFGEIRKVSINTQDGTFNMAYKTGKGQNELDELQLIKNMPGALTCEGTLSMINVQNKGALMPLANGDLRGLIGHVVFNQGLEIIYRIGQQLKCLKDKGMNYYDLKAANCVYFCRRDGEIDIALADMGSVMPSRNFYTSTTPPPRYYDGLIPVNMEEMYRNKTYSYLLICLLIELTTNVFMPIWKNDDIVYFRMFDAHLEEVMKKLRRVLNVNHELYKMLTNIRHDKDINSLPEFDNFIPMIQGLQI